MRYYVTLVAGLVIVTASLTAFEFALYEMMLVGTCASGGPYVSARPCPEGTGTLIGLMFPGIIGALVGTAVFAARGKPPWKTEVGGAERAIGTALTAWAAFWTLTGAVALYAGLGPEANDLPGSKTAAYVIGAVFIPMGVIPFLIGLAGRMGVRRFRRGEERAEAQRVADANAGIRPQYQLPDRPTLMGLPATWSPPGGSPEPRPDPSPGPRPSPAPPAAPATPPEGPPAPPAPTFPSMPSVPPIGAVPPPNLPGPMAPAADKLAELERLAGLRDRGLISPVEFEQAKQKILRDL